MADKSMAMEAFLEAGTYFLMNGQINKVLND